MLLQDLYNKVLGFFRQTDTEQQESSKDTACNRLRVVLMQDRTNLTPELLERMRGELVELLSKYLEMDKEALELNLEQDGDQVALMLSIPVIRAKDEDEIKAALEKEDSEEKAEDDSDEDTEEVDEDSDEDLDKDSEEETEEESEENQQEDSEEEPDEETDEDSEDDDDIKEEVKPKRKK